MEPMKKETSYDEYMEDKEFARIMAQEELIMDVTEGFCRMLEEEQLTRSNLAKTMGKTRGYISQILNGRRNITLRSLAEIAYHLGYHVNVIFNKRVAKNRNVSLVLKWDMTQRKSLPPQKVNVADDYRGMNSKISRLGI
jgi:transcriptional regulator with XRE-family HTH domain